MMTNPTSLLEDMNAGLDYLGYGVASPVSFAQEAYHQFIKVRHPSYRVDVPYSLAQLPQELQDAITMATVVPYAENADILQVRILDMNTLHPMVGALAGETVVVQIKYSVASNKGTTIATYGSFAPIYSELVRLPSAGTTVNVPVVIPTEALGSGDMNFSALGGEDMSGGFLESVNGFYVFDPNARVALTDLSIAGSLPASETVDSLLDSYGISAAFTPGNAQVRWVHYTLGGTLAEHFLIETRADQGMPQNYGAQLIQLADNPVTSSGTLTVTALSDTGQTHTITMDVGAAT